jgi:hypothetical protein
MSGLLGMETIMLTPSGIRMPARWLVLSACLVTSAGCYRYVPTTIDAVTPGDKVRAVLSTEARDNLRSTLGMDVAELEGRLLENNGDAVLLSVPSVRLDNPYGARTLHQNIDVPRQGIVRVDVREVDKFRTYGLIGIGVGAAVFITTRMFTEGEPGSPNGNGGEPPEHITGVLFRVPIIRW